ncbi:DUF4176 domain-containing protein [Streptococcus sp. H49]|uniref:DUF4176 domain-containing protein n=1 Tax=Streptococcus huangxiaojuni TaxID=3237239 RepID=UPI0034A4190B
MTVVDSLYQAALERLPISELAREVLNQFGYSVTSQREIFRDLQLAFFTQQNEYTYQGIIGVSTTLHFDWPSETVTFNRLDAEVVLALSDFKRWLAETDLLLAPVLPLGTVVELDSRFFPEALVKSFEKEGIPFRASISGRRFLLHPNAADEHSYVDYLATIYPYGIRLDTEPLLVPNYMIERIVQEGYQDEQDAVYVEAQYRRDYFHSGILSGIYK